MWVEIRCNIETIVGSWSRPARALGVEISVLLATIWTPIQSRPARALGVEMALTTTLANYVTSRPARALGVEIPSTFLITRLQIVEAREGLGG